MSGQLLSLLEAARQAPHEDGPRLVLADWLEENGEPVRAEFLRLQCCLVPWEDLSPAQRGELETRSRFLLDRHGGAWLGSLWRGWPSPLEWHRGLLSVRFPCRFRPEDIPDTLPWIDTALLVIQGRQGFQRAEALLAGAGINHLHLDLRRPMGEATLFRELERLPEQSCLRTLTLGWPLLLLRRISQGGESLLVPAVGNSFLSGLVRRCRVGRHLSHLASSVPFAAEQDRLLRELGIEPVASRNRLWMHQIPPSCFHRRSR
jgi:uncharacterized protein (TIGR02996 family)